MNVKKALATGALGLGLGAIALPSAAFASVSLGPSVARPGQAVSILVSCSPGVHGHVTITGMGQAYDVNLPPASDGARGTINAPTIVGTYKVTGECNGVAAGTATLTVTPAGGPQGGDGGSADNGGMITAGAVLIGASALGGLVLLRRRAAGDVA